MCSTMLLVVQSTMVFGRSVRGSAAKATTTSSAFMRSWAAAGSARARTVASTARDFRHRIKRSSSFLGFLRTLHVSRHRRVVPVAGALEGVPEADGPRVIALDQGSDPPGAHGRQRRI